MSLLLSNVHEGIELETNRNFENLHIVSAKYDYYHYVCDGIDDRGWGCGYRTLQTIASWIRYNCNSSLNIPPIRQIQSILVELEDKPKSFLGSREWIGSFEVSLVIDKLYDIPCKIIHVKKGELSSIVPSLVEHFDKFGSPIMMGGDVDCSSKGILGIDVSGNEPSLLVVDPHFVGKHVSIQLLQNKGYVKWQPISDFLNSSFYNLCLPQAKPHTVLR